MRARSRVSIRIIRSRAVTPRASASLEHTSLAFRMRRRSDIAVATRTQANRTRRARGAGSRWRESPCRATRPIGRPCASCARGHRRGKPICLRCLRSRELTSPLFLYRPRHLAVISSFLLSFFFFFFPSGGSSGVDGRPGELAPASLLGLGPRGPRLAARHRALGRERRRTRHS